MIPNSPQTGFDRWLNEAMIPVLVDALHRIRRFFFSETTDTFDSVERRLQEMRHKYHPDVLCRLREEIYTFLAGEEPSQIWDWRGPLDDPNPWDIIVVALTPTRLVSWFGNLEKNGDSRYSILSLQTQEHALDDASMSVAWRAGVGGTMLFKRPGEPGPGSGFVLQNLQYAAPIQRAITRLRRERQLIGRRIQLWGLVVSVIAVVVGLCAAIRGCN